MGFAKEEQFLLSVIKAVLHNKNVEVIEEDMDKSVLLKIAKSHRLENFLYYGLKEMNLGELSVRLAKSHKNDVYRAAIFAAESELLFHAFAKNEIKFMPLKGLVIKYLYPHIDLRTMVDVDILFDESKKKEVKKVMVELGYKVKSYNAGNHDVYLKDPLMHVEMHHSLIDESYSLSQYYKSIWNRVILEKDSCFQYRMTDEDFYLFLIAHTAKHFLNGGTGIRNIIDIYLYLEKYKKELNINYIESELEKLGLLVFSKKISELAYYWFDEGETNQILEQIGSYVVHSGVYGNITNAAIINILLGKKGKDSLTSSKIKYILRRIFPSYSTMKRRNKILKKIPILLPWFWFTRLLTGICRKESRIKEMDAIDKVKQEDIEKIKEIREELGVKEKI